MSRHLASIALGPLVGPECRRASRRGWLFAARTASALLGSAAPLVVLWWWWINWNEAADPDFSPFGPLRGALAVLVGLGAAIGLVLGPAVLAGSLSGEQERGSMGLLLTTRVNAFEVVAGRLSGRFSQVAMILLATAPLMLLLAFLSAIGPASLLTMLLYGPALALGACGLTAGVAVACRRGRDALLGSYAIGLGLIVAGSLLPGWTAWGAGLSVLNPFAPIVPLAWAEDPMPALLSASCWLAIGSAGLAAAIVRLRPNSLKWLDGDSGRRGRRATRRGKIPPLGARPMLWKEIYIERRNSLGGLGRWLGYLAVGYLVIASTLLAGRYLDALLRLGDLARADEQLSLLQEAIVDTSSYFGVFIQWAVGLRAAVAIAGERDRETWDALLTSPLEGREIVGGKLLGSLHALRWLFLATLFAWSLALGIGAMTPREYLHAIAWTGVISAFMAAVGVRMSLASSTATTAMAMTIGAWLGAIIGLSMLAGLLTGLGALGFVLFWVASTQFGLQSAPAPWFPIGGDTGFALLQLLLYAGITSSIVAESRARFDRLAGRIVPDDAWATGEPRPDAPRPGPAAEPVLASSDQPG
ncbi:ABC transporter permease [Tautonia plasticadhaerens]|uniref:ABC-2 family transporter protein n=1 Tax=Tautonia plasticadhaerens TaxID=2527974 RepID=A0A518GZW8_9BACT|nr:ABC transporter permease subunit [Tautonia plasticadhaerens]QDV34126.1 ABC-2 family transporter protein [Tautonia plasticadhaerens]